MKNFRIRSAEHTSGKRSGFTLTELAIVLGVIGAIIAGIWVASSSVSERSKLTNAMNQYTIVSQNMTALLQGGYGVAVSPCGAAAPPCSITANMITSQTIPQSYVTAGNATNPWGNAFAMYWISSAPQTYRMSFYGVSQTGCPGLIMAITACSAGKPGCPIKVGTAGTAPAAPTSSFSTAGATMTTTEAATLCAANNYAGGVNSVEFDFTQ